ncbi:MAG: hypothetical protein E6G95_10545 [Alphaproteobacteria bacterium]|nr:MAG: hypothetical protein E6G95_10545 [Alphaproteobacteria bacterium]
MARRWCSRWAPRPPPSARWATAAGPAGLVDFLAVTAIAGGLLGLAILAGAPIGQPAVAGPLRARLRRGLPYGPAIAAGGLWVAASQAVS